MLCQHKVSGAVKIDLHEIVAAAIGAKIKINLVNQAIQATETIIIILGSTGGRNAIDGTGTIDLNPLTGTDKNQVSFSARGQSAQL